LNNAALAIGTNNQISAKRADINNRHRDFAGLENGSRFHQMEFKVDGLDLTLRVAQYLEIIDFFLRGFRHPITEINTIFARQF
jgi:hypothetical protein